MKEKIVRGMGVLLIVIAIIILLTMNQFVKPVIEFGSMDTSEYYIETVINIVRYTVLSIILSSIGAKLLFKK